MEPTGGEPFAEVRFHDEVQDRSEIGMNQESGRQMDPKEQRRLALQASCRRTGAEGGDSVSKSKS